MTVLQTEEATVDDVLLGYICCTAEYIQGMAKAALSCSDQHSKWKRSWVIRYLYCCLAVGLISRRALDKVQI